MELVIKDGKVTISKERYFRLMCAERKLKMLENGGVDNWDWYGESLNPDDGESYSDYEDTLEIELNLLCGEKS